MEQTAHVLTLSALISASNPLELIKSRIQTMNQLIARGSLHQQYRGFFDCLKSVKKGEGIKGLWKGNSISLLRFFPNEKMNNDVKNMVKNVLPSSCWANIVSGVFGGWVAAGILYPIDTVRIFLATSSKKQSQTLRELAKNIKGQGKMYLYRGYKSSLLGIALFRGSYFGLYDTFKGKASSPTAKWMTAYLSGLFAGMLVYPIQTLRKRKIIMQSKLHEVSLLRQMIQKEGIRSLFRGCAVTPFQSLAGAAILLYFDRN